MPYLIVLIIAALLISALNPLKGPKKITSSAILRPNINAEHAIESLQKALTYPTVSYEERALENGAAFQNFQDFLMARYPFIQDKGTVEIVDKRGILITLKGTEDGPPVVLMSHYDVVPVNGTWQADPFSGTLIEGRIYGRGALDTKGTLISICEAFQDYFKTHDTLRQTTYLAFGGDEEVRGASAIKMRDIIHQRHPHLDFVLDEGGAVTGGIFPGVNTPVALVGLGEKGFMSVTLTVHDQGGHASTPQKETAITVLARAVRILNRKQLFKARYTDVVKGLLDGLYPYSEDFKIRYLFRHFTLFKGLIKTVILKRGGALPAMMRTTQAFTMMKGSEAMNVLPTKATIGINYRLITGETSDTVLKKITHALRKLPVTVSCEFKTEATSISLMDEPYQKLQATIEKTWKDVITVPYLMVAATDGRHYHAISDHVYRFSAQQMFKQELAMIHSVDESIKIEHYLECVQFYRTLIA